MMGMNRGGGGAMGGIGDRIRGFQQQQAMRGRGTRGPVATPQRPPRAGPGGPILQPAGGGGTMPGGGGGMPGRVMANQRAMAQQMRGGGKPMPGPGMMGRRPPNPTGSRMGGGGRFGGRGGMYR